MIVRKKKVVKEEEKSDVQRTRVKGKEKEKYSVSLYISDMSTTLRVRSLLLSPSSSSLSLSLSSSSSLSPGYKVQSIRSSSVEDRFNENHQAAASRCFLWNERRASTNSTTALSFTNTTSEGRRYATSVRVSSRSAYQLPSLVPRERTTSSSLFHILQLFLFFFFFSFLNVVQFGRSNENSRTKEAKTKEND